MPMSSACTNCPATALPTVSAPARVDASSTGVLRSNPPRRSRNAAKPVSIITAAAARMAGMKTRADLGGFTVFILVDPRYIRGCPIEVVHGLLNGEQCMIGLPKQRRRFPGHFGRAPSHRQPLSENLQIPG